MNKNSAIIYSFSQSSWVSCQTITSNLVDSYKKAFSNDSLSHFNYSDGSDHYHAYKVAKDVTSLNPKKIIFADHRPHVGKLLTLIDQLWSADFLPTLYFHVYGDFTLDFVQWDKVETLLKKYRCQFICASDKQVTLLSKLIDNSNQNVIKAPFPVDSNTFFYDPEARNIARTKLAVGPEQPVFLYAGRESLQKNIITLINQFYRFQVKTGSNAKLVLAGEFDSVGNSFLGLEIGVGYYYALFLKALNNIPSEYRQNIHYIGFLKKDEIREISAGADYYISLSLHNDEDFGMSPAESLCCGLPAILTDWGGLQSFHLPEYPLDCQLVPTKIGTSKLKIDKNLLITLLENAITKPHCNKRREEISKRYQELFSIEGVSAILQNIHQMTPDQFSGFSPLFKKIATNFKKENQPPFYEVTSSSVGLVKSYNKLYRELYECYASEKFE